MTDDNIIKFPGKDQWVPDPKRVAAFLSENADKLDTLIILGLTKQGEEISAYACGDVKDAVFHLFFAQYRLAKIFDEAME